MSKTRLEGLFVDELALLEPTPGYMRLVKDRILDVWPQRRAEAKEKTAEVDRREKAIQQKFDRLDEAFLYAHVIDLTSYKRQRDRLREELTLAQINHHAESIEEIDVEGILAFAERVLPRASDLWVQASLNFGRSPPSPTLPRDRLRFEETRWLAKTKLAEGERSLVSENFPSWNQIGKWLRRVEALRDAA